MNALILVYIGLLSVSFTYGIKRFVNYYDKSNKYDIRRPFVLGVLSITMFIVMLYFPFDTFTLNFILGIVITIVIVNVFSLVNNLYRKHSFITHTIVIGVSYISIYKFI